MILVAMYSKDKEGNYTNHIETENYNNEAEARLKSMALNWAYTVIAEF